MTKDASPLVFNFGTRLGTDTSARELDPETPFHIALLGDFSGRAQRGTDSSAEQSSQLRSRFVDRDNFEEVMQQLDVRLDRVLVAIGEQPISLQFQELDDFDPDVLFDKLDVFADLRSLRQRLLNPNSFDAAAEEVLAWNRVDNEEAPKEGRDLEVSPEAPESQVVKPTHPEQQRSESLSGNTLLDQILGGAQEDFQISAGGIELDLQRLVSEIVAPYSLPAADPRQQDLIGCVDAAIQAIMLGILQHPGFKQLEANWLALRQLVFDLETDSSLKVYLIDVSKTELANDVLRGDDLTQTAIYRLLVEPTVMTPGAAVWGVLSGAYYFDSSFRDVEILGRMATISAAAGAPFVAGATIATADALDPLTTADSDDWQPQVTDCWQTLRDLPDASCLGLVWPRFLLRLPYGASTKPIERFECEEVSGKADQSRLLWGNSAFLFAKVLGQSFMRSRWNFDLGDVSEIDDLPIWIYQEDEQRHAHPCGEWLLKEKAIARVSGLGVMPLISVKERPVVRIAAFHSVRGTPLLGRWS